MAVMASARTLLPVPALRGCKRRARSLLRVYSTVSVNRGPPGERGVAAASWRGGSSWPTACCRARTEYDRFGGVGISMAKQSKGYYLSINPGLVIACQ